MSAEFLNELESILEDRAKEMPEGSYTTTLLNGGLDRILRKIGEESGELIIAAKNRDKEELHNEMADLMFHMMVLLVQQGSSIDEVLSVLKERHQLSTKT